ncbi:filamentous hemagglutinin family protein [Luteolibacter sp. SL250]|uniref:filamentous haemagglutinin family protein n=1 Tax=Luteolibacter sp. SL250 TaxID=2995170 RepID=UPI00226EB7F0|nr:filamentous haemagglutinin family protein [Luteolibacter sp. SL250]WAC21773.1 filamentous hemagglutinin family protein [Luteolibacter sp. SL250]
MKPKRYFCSPLLFTGTIRYGMPVFSGLAIFISGISGSHAGIYGGAPGTTPAPQTGTPTTGGAPTPANTEVIRTNAQETLHRLGQAVGAAKALQDAARAAAISGPNNLGPNPNQPGQTLPDVPNGLAPGGLQPATGAAPNTTLWQGAELPTANADNLNQVTIRQTAQQALLTWQTFNVGKDTTLHFNQTGTGAPASQSIAFNKVVDPTANPTQILGQIKAEGQVYVINPNGIIFGGSSQINTGAFTASALPINDALVAGGLLNNPSQQFLFNGLGHAGKLGDVTVQAGARLTTPVSADGNGGRVTLVGANVTNDGTISTPNGQTIIASGLQVGFAAHASTDPSLRGLDVYVGSVSDPASVLNQNAGMTTNGGIIEAARGSITLAGKAIRHDGILDSTTSVSLNGRIDILAHYDAVSNASSIATSPFLNRNTGTVELGEGSVIRILPEWNSTETTVGLELALRSMINVQGRNIHLGKDASILAPNAIVNFSAGNWNYLAGTLPTSTFVSTGGQIYLDEGSLIHLAGTAGATATVAQNLLTLELRGSELAVAPVQRDGELRGETITVDLGVSGTHEGRFWIGTPLADLTGYSGLVQRNVGQLTTEGGTLNLSAGSSAVVRNGATIDVSGGWTDFTGALLHTTQLIQGNNLVDISKALPGEIYRGIFKPGVAIHHEAWGITDTFSPGISPAGSYYRAGYTQGADGGTLNLTAPAIAMDGTLMGHTVTGPRQVVANNPLESASLNIRFQAQTATGLLHSPTPPSVIFTDDDEQTHPDAFQTDASGNPLAIPADRISTFLLSPEKLAASGFGNLSIINPDGDITLPENTSLNLGAGSSISLTGSNITINGSITAAGGELAFRTHNLPQDVVNAALNSNDPLPQPIAGHGIFTLGASGSISTAGLITDLRGSTGADTFLPVNGGIVSINSFTSHLSEGGLIDVSGGLTVSAAGSISYGNGGSLAIAAGRDLSIDSILGGSLHLGSTLRGYSGTTRAGSLSFTAPRIQVGGESPGAGSTWFDTDFFNEGGFGSFSLTGIGTASSPTTYHEGLIITDDARINPVVQQWFATTSGGALTVGTITNGEGMRAAGNLSFRAVGITDTRSSSILARGSVLMEQGAVISTDAGGSITFQGDTVTLHGTAIAAGGSINVTGASSYRSASLASEALPTVHLGSTAHLSTAGKTVLIPNVHGFREGTVHKGGSITVSGNITAESGSVLDVSGTSGVLDLHPGYASIDYRSAPLAPDLRPAPVTLETNAGSITLTGSQMLRSDATLIGHAGGTSASGATLNVSSGRFIPPGTIYNSAQENLIVSQSGSTLTGVPSVGTSTSLPGLGHITVDSFSGGGFDHVALKGNIRFNGDVAIHTPGSLTVATGGVIYGTGNVNLSASHVSLGQAFKAPTLATENVLHFTSVNAIGETALTSYTFAPTHGAGSLTVTADLIDIGNLSLQGIGTARFNATNGDIRGNGTLSAAGSLFFQASQIHPTTASAFNIFAYDAGGAPGSVTITGGSQRSLPMSAGGTLSIHASSISQGGTLRAPIGTINIGWDGTGTAPVDPIAGNTIAKPVSSNVTLTRDSVTSVSAIDPITGKGVTLPYGVSPDGTSWIDPAGNDITISGLPSKQVNLSASGLTTEDGALIDIRGGGDLSAYRWVGGNGGLTDVLNSSASFAVIPTYGFDYAPFAPFNPSDTATNLSGETGYTNSSLKVGDTVTLAAGSGLPAGTYTLLPARYALLPGAFLVTPISGTPGTSAVRPDGSTLVSGYLSNQLNPARTGSTSISRFEIAPGSTVRARAEYRDFSANAFLKQAAIDRNLAVPRLPMDAGYLSFTASTMMSLQGQVNSLSPAAGRGSLIDINSPIDILINGTGTGGSPSQLTISSSLLNSFNAESLLIGGLRTFEGGNITVTTGTGKLTVGDTTLTGTDIILTAKEELILDGNATISAAEAETGADTILLTGNGALVRVSSSTSAKMIREGITGASDPLLAVRPGATLSGGSIVLDSTSRTDLSTDAVLDATSVMLGSGSVAMVLDPGAPAPTGNGLILSGEALGILQANARNLRIRSYTNLDLHGSGDIGSSAFQSLSLQANAIRGIGQNGGTVNITAKNLQLGGLTDAVPSASLPLDGTLAFHAAEISVNSGHLLADGFSDVRLNGNQRIITTEEGSFRSGGDLTLSAPLLTSAAASNHLLAADGAFRLIRTDGGSTPPTAGGLGAKLGLEGASVAIDGNVTLPSGSLTLHATTGDVVIGGNAPATINLDGTSKLFVDTYRYTNGGTVRLVSPEGSVHLALGSTITVSAPDAGGNAGRIAIETPRGSAELEGTLVAKSGATGTGGEFTLDTSTIAGGSLGFLDEMLNTGHFTRLRDYRVRTGNIVIDGDAISSSYNVSTDSGGITVTGSIDASGRTGGSISLKANGSLTLDSEAGLDVSAADFDSAGKGGSVTLEAGIHRDGVIDPSARLILNTGSLIDLSVDSYVAGDIITPGSSAYRGQFTGTLHLRAPRAAANNDVQIDAIGSTITGASHILVEGVRLHDLTGTDGVIRTDLQNQIKSEANTYLGNAGTASAAYTEIRNRLLSLSPDLKLTLAAGVEIINRTGDLTLGSASTTATSDWDLSSFRFGADRSAGVLTLRAAGDLTFHNALSDGFSGGSSLWLSPLAAYNSDLPANLQSWSYRLTSGADFSSVDYRSNVALGSLGTESGMIRIGKNMGSATATGGNSAVTSSIIANNFQVIRTGSGNIDIHAGRSIQLLNPFASIYTAGTRVANPNRIVADGDFVTPILTANAAQGDLGAAQQNYAAQYSMAGGNVSLHAQHNIERKTRNNSGLIDDSSRQLPNNWLYRRGLVTADGTYGGIRISGGIIPVQDAAASTSWWVDFSNFFQSVGALGGGNIQLTAGNDVKNVDAVIPTNARAARSTPDASRFIELGGGDLTLTAGHDIDGGVYYVERGNGVLDAGGSITTNSTRSPSPGLVSNLNNPSASTLHQNTWLPTALFAGKSSFEVSATGDILLTPLANPFLLPQGVNNRFWYKTYFSTLSADSTLDATSLGGDITLRSSVTLPNTTTPQSILRAWAETQQLLPRSGSTPSVLQPWLRLAETSLAPFDPVWNLTAPNLYLTALSGSLNLAGPITLQPSATGQLELISAGAISAFQPTGLSNGLIPGQSVQAWTSAAINVSDADPSILPRHLRPLNNFTTTSGLAIPSNITAVGFFNQLAIAFGDSGSYTGDNGVLQTKQLRHASGLLHRDDTEPVRIHALSGDLSGLTLFTPKSAVISAAGDILDIAFYLQNLRPGDISTITAGRDIVAYNAAGAGRIASLSNGNAPATNNGPLSGDIQVSGPGTLQVVAGRNLDLGLGASLGDGTGTGINSIGNLRNPYLSPDGADIHVGAGLGPVTSLASSALDFTSFIADFVLTATGASYLDELAPGVDFPALSPDERAQLAIRIFQRILRDTGRDFNNPESDGYRNYDRGMAAIHSLFGDGDDSNWNGSILTQGKDIRTRLGGDINIIAPGGGLALANTTLGNPLTPPGIVTEAGGNISIFTDTNVDIGIGRIFTLRGGDVMIWSSNGDIAAGSSSRTVQSAPPTRVVIDPQSAAVQTDLAGLATGGGIGVLATVRDVPAGDVDLIAPTGTIDAGDAGIRVTGNINLAAVTVTNAGNISAGGTSTGAPAAGASMASIAVSTPPSTASTSSAPQASQAAAAGDNVSGTPETMIDAVSIITAEVIGYGGSVPNEDEDEEERRRRSGDQGDAN